MFFFLIGLLGVLHAETGAFIEIGAQRERKELLLKDKSVNFAFGYIFDFNTLVGMGLQAGYSKLPEKFFTFPGYSVKLEQKAIDFLWNPLVLNLGKFRFFSKLGQSRFYSSSMVNGKSSEQTNNYLTVGGVGFEMPVAMGICISVNYLQQFRKNPKLLTFNGMELMDPCLNRFELSLRYNFPYQ